MSHHGYIDESGTLGHQQIMTVALVVLNGARAADKLHVKLAKATVPNAPKMRGLAELEKWYASQRLHFADMENTRKLKLGKALSTATVAVFVASFKHVDVNSSHEQRFEIYKRLLKATINSAFETFSDLSIGIAKQGGWEDYEKPLLAELRDLPEAFTAKGFYRKGVFYLASGAKPGLQIADFYASSSRNARLAHSGVDDLTGPYELIKHQVKNFEEIVLETLIQKEK